MVLLRQYCSCHYSYKDIGDTETGTNLRLRNELLSEVALEALSVLNVAGVGTPVVGLGIQSKPNIWVLTALECEDIQSK